MKQLMTGNEAAARGAYEGGLVVGSAYPGTPSTEIFENLPQYKEKLYCEWAPNERWPPRWPTVRPLPGCARFAP